MEHLLDVDDPHGKASDMNLIGNTGKSYTMRGQFFLDAVAGKGEDETYAASVKKAEGLYFKTLFFGNARMRDGNAIQNPLV